MRVTSSALLALSISSLAAMAQAEEMSQAFVPTEVKTGASSQSEASGFVEGQSLGGTTRNWYANELKRNNGRFTYNDHGVENHTAPDQLGARHHH